LDYRVLGPLLEVVSDGTRVIFHARERNLVTTLLIFAGSPVGSETLMSALWGDGLPRNPGAALRVCVSRARGALGPAGACLTAVPGGYLADVAPQDLDLGQFWTLRAAGDQLIQQGQLRRASIMLERALACWREPALVNLPDTPEVDAQRTRLLEQRQTTTLAWADLLLELGDQERILPFLHARTVADPLGERSWAQFIAALHQSGRRDAALAAYSQARACLVRTFGTEPGAELKHLLDLVLTGTAAASRFLAPQLTTAPPAVGPRARPDAADSAFPGPAGTGPLMRRPGLGLVSRSVQNLTR
jgi:DNA-binding SARP family transcriptional activator